MVRYQAGEAAGLQATLGLTVALVHGCRCVRSPACLVPACWPSAGSVAAPLVSFASVSPAPAEIGSDTRAGTAVDGSLPR